MEDDKRTIQDLAREALGVQDACNMVGLALGFGRSMQRLNRILAGDGIAAGTMEIREHPITRLWASKISELAGDPNDSIRDFKEAYDGCKKIIDS